MLFLHLLLTLLFFIFIGICNAPMSACNKRTLSAMMMMMMMMMMMYWTWRLNYMSQSTPTGSAVGSLCCMEAITALFSAKRR